MLKVSNMTAAQNFGVVGISAIVKLTQT